jgi:hypothetical protein
MLYTFKKYLDYFSKISIELKYLVIIIMFALIIDMEISNEAHLIDKYISNDIGIIIFILVSLTYLVRLFLGGYFLLSKGSFLIILSIKSLIL